MEHLTALRVFRNVVHLGSFARAARQLQVSPAAVSKNVSELESHLGVRLLNRTTRRMSLTEAGTLYYEQVCRILDDLDEAGRSLACMQVRASGVLRVSAPMSLTLTRLSAAIPAFLQAYPELSLDLHLEDRRVDIIQEGFDVAIRGTDHLEDSTLVARPLTVLPHVLCGSPAYFQRYGMPDTPDSLLNHNCLRFTLSGHADEWTFHRNGQTVRVPVRGRYQVNSSLAVRDALRAGFGLSLVPRTYVEEDLAQGRLRTALNDWAMVDTYIYAVYPSRRHVAAKVRAFVDFAIGELQSDAYRGPVLTMDKSSS
ncbi:LysR family transcriptional regulator [Bordetella sp. BOR01]|uniref:LysR family transcriptional regulator n=1 Tax=Bordetella sp. BOR01 TaxID=2854779 RepID=UPI001C48D4B2|nr:LysR family transcriptional regulator [Bordetella sp. BOR01]MBV7483086.1 LysR family transcriptional regulator [Bordetella sp. BOR01]